MRKNLLKSIITCASVLMALSACGKDVPASQNSQDASQTVENVTTESETTLPLNTNAAEITPAESFAGGSGTEEDPYQIETREQLKLMADLVNGKEKEYRFASYVLANDIEINPTADIANWETSAPQYNWTVIGDGANYNSFCGHFDGQGHTVSGLFYSGEGDITGSGRYDVGFFGMTEENAFIENLTLKDSKFFVKASGECGIGGIVGDVYVRSNTVIRNCVNYADIVIDAGKAGGIAGVVGDGATIESCMNFGTIESRSGYSVVGGVIGNYSGYHISDCVNVGNVVSQEGELGGVIGNMNVVAYTDLGIKNSDGSKANFNYGPNITSSESTVTGLKNSGSVSRTDATTRGSSAMGGVIGSLANGGAVLNVSALFNEGEVNGSDDYIGGVIGYLSVRQWDENDNVTTIDTCENFSELSSVQNDNGEDNLIGGIFGYIQVSGGKELIIDSCINSGLLTGSAGGVINTALVNGGTLTVKNSVNKASILAQNGGTPAGIAYILTCAKSANEIPNNILFDNCANLGSIDCTGVVMGGIIGWAQLMNTESSSFEIRNCQNQADINFYYSPDVATSGAKKFAAGIIGWLGADKGCTYLISDNINTGNMILNADGVDKDTLADEIKYFRHAAIVGFQNGNVVLSGNDVSGKLTIPSISFETDLPEAGSELISQ